MIHLKLELQQQTLFRSDEVALLLELGAAESFYLGVSKYCFKIGLERVKSQISTGRLACIQTLNKYLGTLRNSFRCIANAAMSTANIL